MSDIKQSYTISDANPAKQCYNESKRWHGMPDRGQRMDSLGRKVQHLAEDLLLQSTDPGGRTSSCAGRGIDDVVVSAKD